MLSDKKNEEILEHINVLENMRDNSLKSVELLSAYNMFISNKIDKDGFLQLMDIMYKESVATDYQLMIQSLVMDIIGLLKILSELKNTEMEDEIQTYIQINIDALTRQTDLMIKNLKESMS